jgi:hypothetical protein
MEPVSSPLPSPSGPWSHIAVTHGDFGREGGESLGLPGPRAAEDAAQLRARLLRMIVDSEQSRKSTAAENFHAR